MIGRVAAAAKDRSRNKCPLASDNWGLAALDPSHPIVSCDPDFSNDPKSDLGQPNTHPQRDARGGPANFTPGGETGKLNRL